MVINFMDKAILGIVAVPLMADLGLSPSEFGLIASSFFLLFSISAIGFGLVADRVSSKKLLLVCAGIWGIAQFPLAFMASVPLLYFSRILLGAGEGPAYPLALHACYKWFPNDKRNLPSAVIFQGVTAGLLISGPLLTFVVVKWSWHAAFFVLGVASLVWMALWAYFGAEGKVVDNGAEREKDEVPRLPYRLLITDRTFLANMLMYWTTYWIFSVMFTWVPSYMRKVMNYDATDAGWMFMVFTAFNVPIVLGGSWISQKLMKKGFSSKYARGGLTSCLVLLGGVLILTAVYLVQQPLLKVILLAIGCNLPQISFVLSSTIVAEIMPGAQRSSMMSINSALATTGGLFAPALMGGLIQGAATPALGYDQGFMVAGLLCVVTSFIGFAFVNPEASKNRFVRLVEMRRSQPAILAR
ncbi:Sugar phosphate permease [Pseudomonas jinjuensis]|uniref:Sugar phosphate permease n=2 Tax=Pseudomonas jinjuensis TaxID=198616 RepID=A0A1H0EHN0_9PSED|nr:Sugar phosphate permease [Pseudomonas jinjuensis]